jgi:hypothetical protein
VSDGAGRSVTVSNWGVAQLSRHRLASYNVMAKSCGMARHGELRGKEEKSCRVMARYAGLARSGVPDIVSCTVCTTTVWRPGRCSYQILYTGEVRYSGKVRTDV